MRIILIMLAASFCFAADEEMEPLSQEVLDHLATLPDNTGAISSSDSAAEIIEGETTTASGASEGEITLRRTSAGIDVYNGFMKVEAIAEGSDGWVGRVADNGSSIDFEPAGRPVLNCPAQSISDWYGPCKVEESSTTE